jgi:DNA-binding transcriptional LysR family regulator
MGSFSAAAYHLNQSPSAISKHLNRLEEELGTKLLNRSTHRHFLTEAGRLFLLKAKKLLSDIDAAIKDIHDVNDDFKGTVRIHMTPAAGRSIVLPLVCEFCKMYPMLHIELTVTPTLVDVFGDGFDLCVRAGGGEDDVHFKNSSVEATKLADARYIICASPEYLKRHGRPTHPRELRKHQCIVYTAQPSPNRWGFVEGKSNFLIEVKPHISTNDASVVYDAALSGTGIARLWSTTVETERAKKQLQHLFGNFLEPDRGIWAFYPRMTPPSKKLLALLDYLKKAKP